MFKIGDRMRIKLERSRVYLKTGVIYRIVIWASWNVGVLDGDSRAGETCYLVDIDGVGKNRPEGERWGFSEYYLEPLTPPHEKEWESFRDLYLRPDPAVILAKEKV